MRAQALIEAELTDAEEDRIIDWCAENGSSFEVWATPENRRDFLKRLDRGEVIYSQSGMEDEDPNGIEQDLKDAGKMILYREDNLSSWEILYRNPKPHELNYESLQERRMLSAFEQLRVLARRKTAGRIVFSDKINATEVAPQDARTILTVWKTKSLNDKAKIEKGVGKDETTYKRILDWARKQVRFR